MLRCKFKSRVEELLDALPAFGIHSKPPKHVTSSAAQKYFVSRDPFFSLALAVYNGDGTGTLTSLTETVNGSSSTAASLPITFTVNRDCTGSKTVGSGPSAIHMNFVISPDGSKITWIVTDPGVTMTGTGVRQDR
jgi:hypothetical protein